MTSFWLEKRSFIGAILMGSAYGLLVRFTLGRSWSGSVADSASLVMTAGFLVFVPVAMGYLTVNAAEQAMPRPIWTWIVMPWIAVVIMMLAAVLCLLEGWICIALALPIALIFSSVGGLAAGWLVRRSRRQSGFVSACVALLPFLIAPLEMQTEAQVRYRHLATDIFIQASPERVWSNIQRVPRIAPSELPATWTQMLGFPRPVEATLSYEGVGGVRHASFEGGLLFLETVTEWRRNQSLGFLIRADTKQIPATTLDEHVTIGGRYFDVLSGRYEIEPLASGGVMLHLSSEERLSTDFNFYAGVWSDAVMRNIQESILHVVKRRCER